MEAASPAAWVEKPPHGKPCEIVAGVKRNMQSAAKLTSEAATRGNPTTWNLGHAWLLQ